MTGENFPVALRVLPSTVRTDLGAVYRFARFVDDVGDEAPVDTDGRLRLLDAVADDVRRLGHGTPVLAPVADLADLTARHAVPRSTYLDLVEANRVDQRRTGYETFADLLGYCRLSAAPVGASCCTWPARPPPTTSPTRTRSAPPFRCSSTARTSAEDARRGRVYLPAAELRAVNVADSALRAAGTAPALRSVIAEQVTRSRALLEQGRPLVGRLSGWARLAVAGYVAGGLATADALERAHHEVLARPVTPSTARTALAAARLWSRR